MKGTLRVEKKRLLADLALLLVALIWGSAFVAQRVAADQIGPLLYNGVRFTLGALVLLPLALRRPRSAPSDPPGKLWRGGLLAGSLLFAGSFFQQAGIQFTTAGKAGFITGLYVVLVPLLLALLWRQRSSWLAWLAALIATVGLYLLSTVERLVLAPGDGLELIGALIWAFHVIVVGRLAQKLDVVRLAFAQNLVCAGFSLAAGLVLEWDTVGGLLPAWWTWVYAGVFSVGVAYTLQVVGQKWAPATDAAVILSGEGVFAALFGWVLLDEVLTTRQLWGCGLMLAGMLLVQLRPHKKRAESARSTPPR